MNIAIDTKRPETLADVACWSNSLAAFGMNLRDWQHVIQRGEVRSRPAFFRRLQAEPPRLRGQFSGGDVADAYLAAYAEWLADQAGIERPQWVQDPSRVATNAWFAHPLRGPLLATTPASFRQRNLFTIPEPIFRPSRGRPRVPAVQKQEKARLRQKAYRQRIRVLIEQARRQSVDSSPVRRQSSK
jgi:hypothetical protein